jgi:hypothetical protein
MIQVQTQSLKRQGDFFPVALIGLLIVFATAVCAAQTVVYVSPVPGSTLVSPTSNIIIKTKGSLNASVLSDPSLISVQGSVSGEHSGSTILSDDQQTIVFQPTIAFAPGEVVSVVVKLKTLTQPGNKTSPSEFIFTTSPLSGSDQELLMKKAVNISSYEDPSGRFSVPTPPMRLAKTQNDPLSSDFSKMVVVQNNGPALGEIFMATFKLAVSLDGVHASLVPSDDQYLLILSDNGTPVFDRKILGLATDFKLQPNGNLTYFDNSRSLFYELDSNYVLIDSFKCGNGYQTDNHELLILPNGHALLLGLDPQYVDMRQYISGGNPAATVIGNVIQELDQDKNVVFQWRSFDHFQITDATHENLLAATIDYVHANAIDSDHDGNLLLSSRHLDEITKIDRQTGNVIWRWGGMNNQFTFANDPTGFSHQHSIRRTQAGTLIMFDDGDFHTPRLSRAVEYTMDEQAKSVTLTWQFRHSPDVYAAAMGSVERLPNGNTFIGWGTASPAVTEVRPDGSVAYELQLPDSVYSYRAFRFPWKSAGVATGVQSTSDIPTSFALAQNYPNPFNPSTKIQFSVPSQSNVRLKVYDMMGREVASLVDESKPAGSYTVQFDASRFASGVYCYRLTTSGQALTKLMMLIK